MGASSSVIALLALPSELYVTLVTSTLGSELLIVGGAEGGAEGGVSSLMQTDSPISGPVPVEGGGAWIASSEQLYRVTASTVTPAASDQRFSSVGRYGTISYVSVHTKLVELSGAGPGRELFDLADVHPPRGDGPLADARDACNVEWLVFRGDLARAGVLQDGGAMDASASGSAARRSPSGSDAGGGCALVVANGRRPNGATMLPSLLFLSFFARRRRA
jgi:hypothetical protein